MPRHSNRLKAIEVENAKNEGRSPRMIADGDGLYLRVAPGGRKSWIYRYKAGGQTHDMGLGPYPVCTLAEARKITLDHRRLRLAKGDPLTAKREAEAKTAETQAAARAEAERKTFRQAAEAWIAAKEAEWTAKHRMDIVSSFTAHVYPRIGNIAVANVDTPAVMRVIEPKWLTLTETMSRVRSRIEAVLGFAVTKGLRAPGDNPARWEKHLENLLPKKSKVTKAVRHPKIGYEDIADFMTRLRSREGLTARALEYLILNASRTGEIIKATWSEIDFKARVWVVPADHMKIEAAHRVPLSNAAIALLEALPRGGDSDLIFPGLVNNSMIRLLDTFRLVNRAGEKPNVHGMRGTFSTWATEKRFAFEARELAIAHKVGNSVERRYNTADLLEERRPMMAAWADYCAGITEDKVVQLRA